MFLVQGVGQIKSVGGQDVYVKRDACEHSLRELIKHLKFETPKHPTVRTILHDWQFLQRDLLPLLIFHDKDKKLSFLTLMLLVQLTEPIQEECSPRLAVSLAGHLLACKEAFLEPRVTATLMSHLADCLQESNKSNKHFQMIELILVIFKQCLAIPDNGASAG